MEEGQERGKIIKRGKQIAGHTHELIVKKKKPQLQVNASESHGISRVQASVGGRWYTRAPFINLDRLSRESRTSGIASCQEQASLHLQTRHGSRKGAVGLAVCGRGRSHREGGAQGKQGRDTADAGKSHLGHVAHDGVRTC